MPYLRYESAVPNSRGTHPGVYGLAWRERRSADPGVIRYADADQIVVTPYPLSVTRGAVRELI